MKSQQCHLAKAVDLVSATIETLAGRLREVISSHMYRALQS